VRRAATLLWLVCAAPVAQRIDEWIARNRV